MDCVFLHTKLSKIYYFPSYDYLHLVLNGNTEFTLPEVEEEFLTIRGIKGEKKIYIGLDIRAIYFENIPKEVLQYLASSPYSGYQIKLAIISDGLGQRLLGNFYMNFFKPETKTRLFKTVAEAFTWFEFPDKHLKLVELENALQHNS